VLVKLQKPTVTVYFKLIILAHIALNLDYFHIMTHAISLLNCALSRIFGSFMRYLYTLTLFRRHRIYSLLLQIKLYTHRQKLHNINTTKSLQEVSDRQNSREGDARHDRCSPTPQHKGPGMLTAVLYCVNHKDIARKGNILIELPDTLDDVKRTVKRTIDPILKHAGIISYDLLFQVLVDPDSTFDIPTNESFQLLRPSILSGWKDGKKCRLAGRPMTVHVNLVHLEIVSCSGRGSDNRSLKASDGGRQTTCTCISSKETVDSSGRWWQEVCGQPRVARRVTQLPYPRRLLAPLTDSHAL
jgi:hypothetical protein